MSLIDRYVTDLFNYAAYGDAVPSVSDAETEAEAESGEGAEIKIDASRLKSYYTYAVVTLRGSGGAEMPDELYSFLELLAPADAEAVLIKFVEKAREALGWIDVKIFSAVQLTVAQRTRIENKLEEIFGKEVSMIFRVDPSLIGGLRVLAGDAVLDNSIKTRLTDMKKNVYKEVYLK
jgi:F-type H+-transporting ATPase subunit delta